MIGIIWKSFLAMHLLSNSAVFGFSLAYVLSAKRCAMDYVGFFKKVIGVGLALSGLSGIVLLSILTHNGLEDLFANSIGLSIVFMLLGYIISIFVSSFGFMYKGQFVGVYQKIFGTIGVVYMLVYVIRVFLVS